MEAVSHMSLFKLMYLCISVLQGSVYYGSGSDSSWDRQYDDTEVDEVSGDDPDGSGCKSTIKSLKNFCRLP